MLTRVSFELHCSVWALPEINTLSHVETHCNSRSFYNIRQFIFSFTNELAVQIQLVLTGFFLLRVKTKLLFSSVFLLQWVR